MACPQDVEIDADTDSDFDIFFIANIIILIILFLIGLYLQIKIIIESFRQKSVTWNITCYSGLVVARLLPQSLKLMYFEIFTNTLGKYILFGHR